MIEKLKTYEEERAVKLIDMYSVEITKSQVRTFLEQIYSLKIQSHLKRIKSNGDNLLVLLGSLENLEEVEEETKKYIEVNKKIVKVAAHQPITDIQYEEARKYWPVIKAHRFIEKIDEEYVYRMAKLILKEAEGIKTICTRACIISTPEGVLSIQKDSGDILGHSVFKAIDEVNKSQVGYLCTGFDAFLYGEPCLSCSVAFVHGRIKKVFFVNNDDKLNQSYTKLKINYNKNLNHRYPVYLVKFINNKV